MQIDILGITARALMYNYVNARGAAAGGCPTSEQDCLVGRRDLLDCGAAAGGFRSGFRLDIFHNICSITYSHIDDRVIT